MRNSQTETHYTPQLQRKVLQSRVSSLAHKRLPTFILMLGVLLVFVVACATDTPVVDRCESGQICIGSEFFDFYIAHDGDTLFGEPITQVLEPVDQNSQNVIQYFDNVILEYSTETGSVSVAPLGQWGLEGRDSYVEVPVPEPENELSFEDTGFTVQDAFYDFYVANQGERLFGNAISPQIYEGDLLVQYFENVRLVWYPEAQDKIQVAALGQAYYLYEGVQDYIVLVDDQIAIVEGDTPIEESELVELSAAVQAPILYSGDRQIVYVSAATPSGHPADGVAIELLIRHTGQEITQAVDKETSRGTVQAELDIDALQGLTPGEDIEVEVIATRFGEEVGRTMITFLVWW